MNVSELIETLKAHPGDLRVVVNGYEERLRRSVPRPDFRAAHCAEHRRQGLGGTTRIRLGSCHPRSGASDHS